MVSPWFVGLALAQTPYQDIKYPKLNDIRLPQVEQVTLSNGMRLFVLEDHELPLIRLSALIRGGSINEPPEKVGLASLTGSWNALPLRWKPALG
jgi:zinc protease